MLPCNLYHLNGSLKQRATGERLHKLISTHPNGYMPPPEFWELVRAFPRTERAMGYLEAYSRVLRSGASEGVGDLVDDGTG